MKNNTTDVTVVTPEVMPALGEIEEPSYTKASERINFHVSMAQHHGRQALAHLISAGWELAKQQAAIGYGGWAAWCENELSISRQMAARYITLYQKVLGEQRAADGIPLAKRITNKELEAATVGMEDKSARAAMIDLGIIRRPDGWGGSRKDRAEQNGHKVGRKPKDVAKELKALAENETIIWAAAKGSLDTLWRLDAERDMFHRLTSDHLGQVSGILSDLAKKAEKAVKQRQSGMITTTLGTSEVVRILSKDL